MIIVMVMMTTFIFLISSNKSDSAKGCGCRRCCCSRPCTGKREPSSFRLKEHGLCSAEDAEQDDGR